MERRQTNLYVRMDWLKRNHPININARASVYAAIFSLFDLSRSLVTGIITRSRILFYLFISLNNYSFFLFQRCDSNSLAQLDYIVTTQRQ